VTPSRCPACRQSIPVTPVRICSLCKNQIVRHDKWCFGQDGRVRHRHCDNPGDYFPPEIRKAYVRLKGKGREAAAWEVLRRWRAAHQ
jgi:hypothetical protein